MERYRKDGTLHWVFRWADDIMKDTKGCGSAQTQQLKKGTAMDPMLNIEK